MYLGGRAVDDLVRKRSSVAELQVGERSTTDFKVPALWTKAPVERKAGQQRATERERDVRKWPRELRRANAKRNDEKRCSKSRREPNKIGTQAAKPLAVARQEAASCR